MNRIRNSLTLDVSFEARHTWTLAIIASWFQAAARSTLKQKKTLPNYLSDWI
ncbi:hypothetical protein [Paenibacillus baekrokdamisoli]|uniref:hypothetical protein n=1 Tax=Paenibacillus baekrokdamisoli TaxID=1712516 RepID=UPI0013DF4E1D|nr:hypothetical protein [Paenibacillus baekrokdamisoli]